MTTELKNTITLEAVNNALEAFKVALSSSKGAAQTAAIAVLVHCFQHRDASCIRNMLELIESEGKDFVRRAPFTMWLRAYAPVHMVSKTVDKKTYRNLEFDKTSPLLANADAVIAEASAKLWWTMSADKEVGAFDVLNFDKRILGIAKKALKELAGDATADAGDIAHVQSVLSQFELYVQAGKAVKLAIAA